MKTRRCFHGCGCTDLPSSASHHAGWVDATDLQDWPSFVVSEMSCSLGIQVADVLSPSFVNPGRRLRDTTSAFPVTYIVMCQTILCALSTLPEFNKKESRPAAIGIWHSPYPMLPLMASGDRCGKRTHGRSSHLDSSSPPTR
jgi:hypothetical protein